MPIETQIEVRAEGKKQCAELRKEAAIIEIGAALINKEKLDVEDFKKRINNSIENIKQVKLEKEYYED